MIRIKEDEKGFLSLLDGLLSLVIISIALIGFITFINMDISPYSKEIHDFQKSQDVLEIMALNIDENSYSTLKIIQSKLQDENNSLQSIDEVGIIAGEFLNKTIPNKNYSLVEINQLNGKTIVSTDNLYLAENLSSSSKSIGSYLFILYIW